MLGAGADVWIFWNEPSVSMPKAFDYAGTNSNWLYVGLETKIRASEDGGENWFDLTDDAAGNGANDVFVDPMLPMAVYVWSDTGNLDLWIKYLLGTKALKNNTTPFMTESPNPSFLRIAKDTNTGRLFAIPNGTALTARDGFVNTVQMYGNELRGLHCYSGGRLIVAESSSVYVSDDNGNSWLDKTGNITGSYGNGLNSHRMMGA
jgi:hypothetical protein